MKRTASKNTPMIFLGRQGENLAREIVFEEPAAWAAEYGQGETRLVVQRPEESVPYPVALALENGAVVWRVTGADTALAGRGRCELRYMAGETVVKSNTWLTTVLPSISQEPGEPPQPQKDWVDQVLEAANRAEAAAANSPIIGGDGTWLVWDFDAGEYVDTGVSASGGGTQDHAKLTNRDAEDQHPIQAVTDLQKELDGKMQNKFLSNLEIQAILDS